ncbi:hypothetical protein AYI69_g3248 [Smittium culicis]|uniref:Uncharacterized protein n=1 Tax=Smittium culicis TaxID=133412 RepID=A0A1R1YKA5_9FUNG|nr:hypothetical protein AYI69_g3248 [Smittium culicis]
MRVLLADIASMFTQGRLDNLHKGMELPGKPHQPIESENKSLMDQEKLDALIASKNPEKSSRTRKPFCGTDEFQNGNADFDIQDDSEEGFHDLTGPRRCIHAYPDTQDAQEVSSIMVERENLPVPRAPVWTFTQPLHFYQGPMSSSDLGSITGHASLGVIRRPFNFRRIDGGVKHENQLNLLRLARTGVQNQGREIFDHAETSYHAFKNPDQHTGHTAESSQLAWLASSRKRKKCHTIYTVILGFHSYSERTCNLEYEILGKETNQMEWAIIPSGKSGTRDIFRLQRQKLGVETYVLSVLNPADSLEPSNNASRMFNIRTKIHDAERRVQSPQLGPARFKQEQEQVARSLLLASSHIPEQQGFTR